MWAFLLYYLWTIVSILTFILCKNIFVDKYSNESIKFPGWLILIFLFLCLLPLFNFCMCIVFWVIFSDEGKIKKGFKTWWNNLWLIKILSREY